MNIRSPCFLIFVLLTACAGPRLSPAERTSLLAVKDTVIMPGQRIGPVFIGMTEAELYDHLGSPAQTVHGDDSSRVDYDWSDIGVGVNTRKHVVVSVYATGTRYATAGGVTVGTTELELMARLGAPSATAQADFDVTHYCFGKGLQVWTRLGKVTRLTVARKACSE